MRENELLRRLCDALTETVGIEFIPETWREGCVSVFLAGGGGKARSYVDGGAIAALPVDIKIRETVRCEADRLRVLGVLASVASVSRSGISLGDGVELARLTRTGSAKKVKVHENGCEEYASPFVLEYYTDRERAAF